MNVTVDIINASGDSAIPSSSEIRNWAACTLAHLPGSLRSPELSVRVVDESESTSLNAHYRHKTGPTNVLSFPYQNVSGQTPELLGDLAICAQVVRQEADSQAKSLKAHWAHMIVHGVLHLSGFDHEQDEEAIIMEALETEILAQLGFTDPYAETGTQA